MEELVAEAASNARPTAPYRVCLVIGRLRRDGDERRLLLLAQGLARHGVLVNVVVLAEAPPGGTELAAAGIPVTHLNIRRVRGWRRLPAVLTATARLISYLRRTRPDVVHAFRLPAFVVATPLARLLQVPAVVAGPAGPDAGPDERLLRTAGRLALRMTDRVVANAWSVAHVVRRDGQVPPGKVTVIYDGVPSTAFVAAEPARVDSPYPIVLSFGGLEWRRGHSHLLEAVGLLRARGLACTLLLTQDGPERARLGRRAAELGIDVRLLEPRTDDTHRLLARADAVVLPSVADGLGDAVLAAMAAGRPVIATEVDDLPELLGGGRGVLVPPGDPVELANALAGVLTDRNRAERMGRAAREWSQIHLHADTMVRRHLALYRELAASG